MRHIVLGFESRRALKSFQRFDTHAVACSRWMREWVKIAAYVNLRKGEREVIGWSVAMSASQWTGSLDWRDKLGGGLMFYCLFPSSWLMFSGCLIISMASRMMRGWYLRMFAVTSFLSNSVWDVQLLLIIWAVFPETSEGLRNKRRSPNPKADLIHVSEIVCFGSWLHDGSSFCFRKACMDRFAVFV
jgi:hypothetical protein